jgi:hypothetical protein
MKKVLMLLVIISVLMSCSKQSCPTTDKKYFTRGVKPSKPLYKGYPSVKGNPMYKKK